MAHWFHRNPLKATAPATFDLRGAASNSQAQKICSDLRGARGNLLEVISNPNRDVETLTKTLSSYISLQHGFINSLDETNPGDSKLRHAVRFRWTNTLLGNTPTEQYDFIFDQTCMLFNVALWYTKHAAKVAGKEEPSMDEAKEVHKCLRIAAGIFTYIKENLVARLMDSPEKGSDLDSRILAAYISQCTAEAQEITIARAIELKHSASIVSALAYETARLFTQSDDCLKTLDEKIVARWRNYLQFKINIYYAYAYNYHGEVLLAADKCGEAIKSLQESDQYYEKAWKNGKEYTSIKGPGSNAKPHEHLFFRKLGPIVKRTLDKCVRENGFIYHQKVPVDAPQLELKATYGLVAPEEFTPPEPSPLWTAEAYKSFDISRLPPLDPKTEQKESGSLPPVKEKEINSTNKDPKNNSGCIIS
ncbi:hypothetical protein LSH36_89g03014 [Paralvinella palmiformis]|uniref:BRO1 domain-containing protein n=1 Tax=Paralvinella palmiformis TaxID=53620 RepID=A0AAD9K1B2_9ANNE|nr:hypothetical protein LSH36_89g03014 [Paralvinella palmiformis]